MMKNLIEEEIRKYYRDPDFTVQHLADKLNVSQSYLREIVHEEFMMSPQKLIEAIRLDESLPLLLTNMDIYTISIKIGYCHSRAYRRAFKNRFGISPYNFREKVKEKAHKEIRKIIDKKLWD
jgi:two-component system response regulator YesN